MQPARVAAGFLAQVNEPLGIRVSVIRLRPETACPTRQEVQVDGGRKFCARDTAPCAIVAVEAKSRRPASGFAIEKITAPQVAWNGA